MPKIFMGFTEKTDSFVKSFQKNTSIVPETDRSQFMKAFTAHPESVGESYFEHLRMSFGFGARMLVSGLGCFLHGIFPFICVKTGSQTIDELHYKMVTHRDKRLHECSKL